MGWAVGRHWFIATGNGRLRSGYSSLPLGLYLQDKAGDEDWHVYSVDLDPGRTTDLTSLENVHAKVVGVSPGFPTEIVVGLNDRDPKYHDLYRIDVSTADRTLVQRNDDFAELLVDDYYYSVRLRVRITPDGGSEMFALSDSESWQPFMKVEMEDLMTTVPFGFDRRGKTFHLSDSRGRDTAAMAAIDLESETENVLAQDSRADVSHVMLHAVVNDIQAVAFTFERKQWKVLDPDVAADMEYLRLVADSDIEIAIRTLDDRWRIVAYLQDDGPLHYYRNDREPKEARFLFTNRSDLEGLMLAKMHPVVNWKPEIEIDATRVGDSRTEDGRALLKERSPLTHVDRVTSPS